MKLTTKGRYAVTAMLDLALHNHGRAVPLTEIASRQGISLSYLEQIFSQLRKAKLVQSCRGPGGGYQICKPLNEISAGHIIEAINENMDVTRCGGSMNCQDNLPCLTHDFWIGLNQEISNYLYRATLQDLMEGEFVKTISARQDQEQSDDEARRNPDDGQPVVWVS